MDAVLQSFFSVDNCLLIFRLAVPIVLAALACTISELGGIMGLGTEGIMLMGAFGAVAGSHYSGSGYIGILSGVLAGIIISLVYGLLCIRFKSNQTVCGVGVNLLATGMTAVLTYMIWGDEGASGKVAQLQNTTIPVLCDIPVLGRLFTNQSPILYVTIFLIVLIMYIMSKTRIGLRLKAISMHPVAVRSVGVNVEKYRYSAIVVSGALAGLAGSYLSISQNDMFINGMTGGRGFLGVAANIFGGWTPSGSVIAGSIFATAESVRYSLLGLNIPPQFVQMVPYIITLLALLLLGKRGKAPKALGKMK